MIKGNRGLQNPVQNLLNCYAKPLSLTEGFMRETFLHPTPWKERFQIVAIGRRLWYNVGDKRSEAFQKVSNGNAG